MQWVVVAVAGHHCCFPGQSTSFCKSYRGSYRGSYRYLGLFLGPGVNNWNGAARLMIRDQLFDQLFVSLSKFQ